MINLTTKFEGGPSIGEKIISPKHTSGYTVSLFMNNSSSRPHTLYHDYLLTRNHSTHTKYNNAKNNSNNNNNTLNKHSKYAHCYIKYCLILGFLHK